MRTLTLRIALCVVALAWAVSGCAGSEPTTTGVALPTTSLDLVAGAKVASLDSNTAARSLVATAKGERVAVYESPGAVSAVRTLPSPNPNGAPLVFLVEEVRGDWLRVLLPVRPNGSTGWVKSGEVKLSRHNYRIEVRLAEFRIKVTQGGTVILDAPIGVAKDNTPTPGGRYYTTELLKPPDANTVYGTYAYGLSGFSEVLESFNGGPGQLGIHGTNDPSSIGKKVSSGCVRMSNDDINTLAMILPLGVPVEIVN